MKRLAAAVNLALAMGLLAAAVSYAQTAEPATASGWSRAEILTALTLGGQLLLLAAGFFLFRIQEQRLKAKDDDIERKGEELQAYKIISDRWVDLYKTENEQLSKAQEKAGVSPQASLPSGPVELEPAVKDAIKDTLARVERIEAALAYPSLGVLPRPTATDLLLRGNAHFAVRDYEAAIKAYSQAIELKPDYALAYHSRGYAYAELGQHPRAIEDFDKAIQLEPNDAFAYSNRGAAYSELGQHQRALEDCDKAIQLKPDYAEAYSNRGLAYTHLGQHQRALEDCDKAIQLYDKAIQLKPDDASAYYNRACANALLGKPKEALADLEKAISLDNKYKEMARSDTDFDSIREDPRFRKMVGLE